MHQGWTVYIQGIIDDWKLYEDVLQEGHFEEACGQPQPHVPGTWTHIINGSVNRLGICDATSVLRRRLLPPRALDGSVVFSDCFSLVSRPAGPLWLSLT